MAIFACVLPAPAFASTPLPQLIADGSAHDAAGSYETSEAGAAGHALFALNGGRIDAAAPVSVITRGQGAAALRAESDGLIRLHGGAVSTQHGRVSDAISVASGGRVELLRAADGTGVRVSTLGLGSAAARVDGGSLLMQGAHLSTTGNSAMAVIAAGGARVQVDDSELTVAGAGSEALRIGQRATAEVTRSVLRANGWGSAAAAVAGGGSLRLQGSSLIAGPSAKGLLVERGGTAVLVDTHIDAVGDPIGVVPMAEVDGGTLHWRGGELIASSERSSGIALRGDSVAELENLRIETGFHAVSATDGDDARLDGVDIYTHGGIAAAVHLGGAANFAMYGGSIGTSADRAVALDNRAGNARLFDVRLTTLGQSSHGLYASMDTGRGQPSIQADGVAIQTRGAGGIGAVARLGGQVALSGGSIVTSGEKSYGVLTGGAGRMSLSGTDVTTTGRGAWAAVINDNGVLDIDGGSLLAERHGALWVRSARQFTARNGARLAGGNGVLAQVDAAFAAPFTFEFSGDVDAVGDIVITPEDLAAGIPVAVDLRLDLAGRSRWQGSSTVLGQARLSGQSQWTLTGDSRVGSLSLDRSAVQLSQGYAGRFHRLVVGGDLDTHGSLLVFNAALGGDASATDFLHVLGSTRGDAAVQVNNVGGLGAQTQNGIQLIQVEGSSDAHYSLSGRAVAGRYEYFLHKGGIADPADGGWYLRSALATVPDPCESDPQGTGCSVKPPPELCSEGLDGSSCEDGPGVTPDPCEVIEGDGCAGLQPRILRPEAGTYLANRFAMDRLLQHGAQDRGVRTGDGVQGWIRTQAAQVRLPGVDNQLSLRSQHSVLQLGADVGVFDAARTRLGVMLTAARARTQARSVLTDYQAQGDVQGAAVGIYANWASEAAYVDAWTQRGRFRNGVGGDALARERYRSHLWQSSLEAGYRFGVGRVGSTAVSLQPELQLVHSRSQMGTHVEHTGTEVRLLQSNRLSGRLGLRLQAESRMESGATVNPYLAANWYRQGTAPQVAFDGEAMGAGVARDRYEVSAGARIAFRSGLNAWGGFGLMRGDQGYREANAQLRVAYDW
ncbi:autotransporter outer membrane beta-barrel domain-containing protein [Stenotrophomonas maltophilia]|uniref:autotransporter outer membrane beta-barrel domain-containing protein n=1 Tax=Stenotrophomonas maltophilia TaxID=40324 RepID=UPI00163D6196|nr:autotransporter outer membrane beta-barrel domain-containing protein [Stenotrophomonas maltophilia]